MQPSHYPDKRPLNYNTR